MNLSEETFAHDSTAQLFCHEQNFVGTVKQRMKLLQYISTKMNYNAKSLG